MSVLSWEGREASCVQIQIRAFVIKTFQILAEENETRAEPVTY